MAESKSTLILKARLVETYLELRTQRKANKKLLGEICRLKQKVVECTKHLCDITPKLEEQVIGASRREVLGEVIPDKQVQAEEKELFHISQKTLQEEYKTLKEFREEEIFGDYNRGRTETWFQQLGFPFS